MMNINYKPIGFVESPHKSKNDVPIQAKGASDFRGFVIVEDEFVDGLKDLDGFSHIYLIYHFHKSIDFDLKVIPFLDNELRGVFSTRAPKRPNSIGISVVKLLNVNNNRLEIQNLDILDGTPVLDIKPYIADFDVFDADRFGWTKALTKNNLDDTKSDNRFV